MIKNSLIESIVKEVILEYGGVSNDIMQMSMTIFNLIYEHHREYRGQTFQIGDKKIYGKTFNLDINNGISCRFYGIYDVACFEVFIFRE